MDTSIASPKTTQNYNTAGSTKTNHLINNHPYASKKEKKLWMLEPFPYRAE